MQLSDIQLKKLADVLADIGKFMLCSGIVTVPLMEINRTVNDELVVVAVLLSLLGVVLVSSSILALHYTKDKSIRNKRG